MMYSVVKIHGGDAYNYNVFKTEEEKLRWENNPAYEQSDGYLVYHKAFLESDLPLCSKPTGEPHLRDFCQIVLQGRKFPQVVSSSIPGSGSFVSPDGYILTVRHALNSCIRFTGTGNTGKYGGALMPCKVETVDVLTEIKSDGTLIYENFKISLAANASRLEAFPDPNNRRTGMDAALIKIDFKSIHFLEMGNRVPDVNERLFQLGFPGISLRNPEWIAKLGYRDADASLRVSVGLSFGQEYPESFLADADTGKGNSGGPVFDEQGKILGIVSQAMSSEALRVSALQYNGSPIRHPIVAKICELFKVRILFPTIAGCR